MKIATFSISIVLLVAVAYRIYRERSESNRQTGNGGSSTIEFQKANQKLDEVLEFPRGM